CSARNTAAAATSSAVPTLPHGTAERNSSLSRSDRRAFMSVSMIPQETQLTRIPDGASSLAAAFVKPISAALEAEYAASHEAPTSPQTEEMLTIHPPPRRRNFGITSRVQKKAPSTLTAKTRRHM